MIVALIVAEPFALATTRPLSAVAIVVLSLAKVRPFIGAKNAAEPSFLIA